MSCHCELREDSRYTKTKLLRACTCDSKANTDLLPRAIRDLLMLIKSALKQRAIHVNKFFGVKLESKPPSIEYSEGRILQVYTGQWVGEVLAHYELLGGRSIDLLLRIKPKYPRFDNMLKLVYKYLNTTISWLTPLLPYILHPIEQGIFDPSIALLVLDSYVRNTRMYDVDVETGKVKINKELVGTTIAALSMMSRSVRKQLDSIILHAERQRLVKLLQIAYTDPMVSNVLRFADLMKDEDMIYNEDVLAEISASLKRRWVIGLHHFKFMRTSLLPSTKIYELLVLAKIVEAFGGILKTYSLTWVETPEATIYYNKPPRNYSRLVYKLANSTPHPDLLVELKNGTILVVDAKYRLEPRLKLAEALRIVGYIADLAKDTRLKAIVTFPVLNENLEYDAPLDSLHASIKLIQVNERTPPAELKEILIA